MFYRIGKETYGDQASNLQEALALAYGRKERPLCLCLTASPSMYIAKISDRYLIKRMPDTGFNHHADCPHFEPPPELSGKAPLLGTAIEENVSTGITALRLGFPLSKRPGKSPPITIDEDKKESVKTEGKKLGLRGLFDYLYEEAGLHKWSPNMAGKRNYYVVRKHILAKLFDKATKGYPLLSLLYMPENFNLEHKEEIAARRKAFFAGAQANGNGVKHLRVLIAEVKEMGEARIDFKLMAKHQADLPFLLNKDLYKRIQKNFDEELQLWQANEHWHLMVIGSFAVLPSGLPSLEEVSLILVDEHWLPFTGQDDYELTAKLVKEGRRFSKGLRYNLAQDEPLATAILTDREFLTALYIKPKTETAQIRLQQALADSMIPSIVWNPLDPLLALPDKQA